SSSRAIAAFISPGWLSHKRVDPSTSARSNVTVPVGSPLTPSSLHSIALMLTSMRPARTSKHQRMRVYLRPPRITMTLMICPYCRSDVHGGVCEKCGAPDKNATLSGWRPDPTARYEGRYYVSGRPTARVRNGRSEAGDPTGGAMLPDY